MSAQLAESLSTSFSLLVTTMPFIISVDVVVERTRGFSLVSLLESIKADAPASTLQFKTASNERSLFLYFASWCASTHTALTQVEDQ
eukprot:10208176-Ditylum_brightwellii.AAC.1